jgi:hypothetical protein
MVRRAISEAERLWLAAWPRLSVAMFLVGAIELVVFLVAPDSAVEEVVTVLGFFSVLPMVLWAILWGVLPALWWGLQLVWAARGHPGAVVLVVALALTWLALFVWAMPILYPRPVLLGRLILISATCLVVTFAHRAIVLRGVRRW